MRMCQEHWDKLRAAVEAAGMTSLVATSGEQAAAQALSSLVPRGREVETPEVLRNLPKKPPGR